VSAYCWPSLGTGWQKVPSSWYILPGRLASGRKACNEGAIGGGYTWRAAAGIPPLHSSNPTADPPSSPRDDGRRGEKGVGVVVRWGKDMRTPDVVVVVIFHTARDTVTMATAAERSNARGNSHSNDITLLYCNTWR